MCLGVAAVASSMAAACDYEVEPDETELRKYEDGEATTAAFWKFGWWKAENGDTQVAADDSVSPFDLVWDLDGASTSQSTVAPNSTDIFATTIRQTVEDQIFDAQGNLLCTAVQTQTDGPKVYQLLDAEGEPVLTLWHRFVFPGDVHVPDKGAKISQLLQQHTMFSFQGERVYDDRWWVGDVVAQADVELAKANPMRKLEIASLLAGECGATVP